MDNLFMFTFIAVDFLDKIQNPPRWFRSKQTVNNDATDRKRNNVHCHISPKDKGNFIHIQ